MYRLENESVFQQLRVWSSKTPLTEEETTDIVFVRALSYFISAKGVCGAAYFNQELEIFEIYINRRRKIFFRTLVFYEILVFFAKSITSILLVFYW